MGESTPTISIVTPVYAPPVDVLRETIGSVLAQTMPDWELMTRRRLLPDPAVREALREAQSRDPRVRVIERTENGHIVAASNDGLDAAIADFVALLDHDDLLVPEALEHVVRVIRAEPEVDYIYSDEDKVDVDGTPASGSSTSLRGHPSACAATCTRVTCRCCAPHSHARSAGSGPGPRARRTTTSRSGSRSRLARSRTYRTSSTTGACSRGPQRATPPPSPTPGTPGGRPSRRTWSGWASTAPSTSAPGGAPTASASARPFGARQRGHPDARRRWAGVGRAPLLRRRGGPVAARRAAATRPRGRRVDDADTPGRTSWTRLRAWSA